MLQGFQFRGRLTRILYNVMEGLILRSSFHFFNKPMQLRRTSLDCRFFLLHFLLLQLGIVSYLMCYSPCVVLHFCRPWIEELPR